MVVGAPGLGRRCREFGTDHELRQLVGGDLGGVDSGDGATLPEHRDGVGDGQDLLQLVVDEDDRVSAGFQLPQVPEQLFNLLGH